MRAAPVRSNDGFSLVELLVAIFVLGTVMSMIYVGLARIQRTTEGATDRLINLDEARLLMDTITKDLRTAVDISGTIPAFVTADARRVTYYGALNSLRPRLIDIFVAEDDRLVECVSPVPTGTPPPPLPTPVTGTLQCPAGTSVRVVGSFIAGSDPIFTYFDTAGAPMTISNPQDLSRLTNIGSVGVTISIQKDSRRYTNVTTLTDRVRLPNILNNLT